MFKKLKSLFRSKSLMNQLLVAFIVFGTLHLFLKANNLEGLANKDTLHYFYKEGCPHCVSFTPEWEKFTNNCGSSCKCNTQKTEEANLGENAKHVKGFPTVMLLKSDGSSKEFHGDRTASALSEFVEQNAS